MTREPGRAPPRARLELENDRRIQLAFGVRDGTRLPRPWDSPGKNTRVGPRSFNSKNNFCGFYPELCDHWVPTCMFSDCVFALEESALFCTALAETQGRVECGKVAPRTRTGLSKTPRALGLSDSAPMPPQLGREGLGSVSSAPAPQHVGHGPLCPPLPYPHPNLPGLRAPGPSALEWRRRGRTEVRNST